MGAMINVKPRLHEERVHTLLGYSSSSDPDKRIQLVDRYRNDNTMELFAYEDEGDLLGIAGFRQHPDGRLELLHLAVTPEERGKGYGRGLLLELLALLHPQVIVAETDDDAVDFYRAVGFEIASLGEKYPGVERYRCTYHASVDAEEDEE